MYFNVILLCCVLFKRQHVCISAFHAYIGGISPRVGRESMSLYSKLICCRDVAADRSPGDRYGRSIVAGSSGRPARQANGL